MGADAKICFGKAKKSFYDTLESCNLRSVNNFFMGLSAILIGLGLGYESKAWRKFQVFQHQLEISHGFFCLGKNGTRHFCAICLQLGSQLHREELMKRQGSGCNIASQ